MENLFKVYGNENRKYCDCTKENFERKYVTFSECCDQADIVEVVKPRAFSIMLIGIERQCYFDCLNSYNLVLDELGNEIKVRFQTPERTWILIRD